MERTPLLHPSTDYGSSAPVMINAANEHKNPCLNITNLSYTVQVKSGTWFTGACFKSSQERQILKNIDMRFPSGQVSAIIGGSGSGKTTLLDVITCRCDGEVTGSIYFKNYVCNKTLMASCSSYVIQADRLLPHLTVRENLRYTAYLCLPGNATAAVIDSKVNEVIHQMGLIKVADSLIGGAVVRGLSGGEKRRVSIAIQLLKDPDILLLDEPTTGLDSFTARYLVKNLREIALSGKVVVMTIHQPRSDIFKLFDQVAILSRGELAYFGRSDELVPHFTRLNFPCPSYSNPLDIYIDVCSVDRRSIERERNSTLRIEDIVKAYRDSPQRGAMLDDMSASQRVPDYIDFNDRNGPGPGRIFYTVVSRMNKNLFRDRSNCLTRLSSGPIVVVLTMIFVGTVGFDQRGIQNRSGIIFQTIMSAMISPFLQAIFLFPTMRDLFYREHKDGLYSSWYFVLAHTIHTFPFNVLSTLIQSSMVYWIAGLYNDFLFSCEFYAILFFVAIISENLTVAGLALVYNPQLVNSILSMVYILSIMVATGFIRSIDSLPSLLKWFGYSSPVKYATEIIMANEYSHINITCGLILETPCAYPTSQSYLDTNYPDAVDDHDRNFGILAAIYFITLLISLLFFRLRKIPNLN